MVGSKTSLLVYIPCWTDYPLALKQAETLRSHHQRLGRLGEWLSLRVVVSIHASDISEAEVSKFSKFADELVVHQVSIGGDMNINFGFLIAAKYEPDFLWILSANDALALSALEEIISQLLLNNFDLLLLSRESKYETLSVRNIFDENAETRPYGLISAVIYRTEKFREYFFMGPKFSFTGWGQLAVIHSGVKFNGKIKVHTIPISKVISHVEGYEKDPAQESARMRFGYRHSFFGMPVLISALYADDKPMSNQYIWKWLCSNWFRVNYFASKTTKVHFDNLQIEPTTLWIEKMAQLVLDNSSIKTRLLYNFVKWIPWEKFKAIPIARRVRRRIRG